MAKRIKNGVTPLWAVLVGTTVAFPAASGEELVAPGGQPILSMASALMAGAVAATRTATEPGFATTDETYRYAVPADLSADAETPDFNLRQETLTWSQRARGGLAGKAKAPSAFALHTTTRDGRLVYWQTGILAIDVSGVKGGSHDLSEAASLKLMLPTISMDAHLTASAGKSQDNAELWQKRGAQVQMQVDAVPKTKMNLSGAEDFSQTYRDPASIGVKGTAPHLLQGDTRTAGLEATVTPIDKTSVTLGASGNSVVTKDTTAPDTVNRNLTSVETQSEKAFIAVSWQPWDWAHFEVTARAHNSGILWRGAQTKNGAYRSSERRAAMALKLGDATVTASLEKAASDYNADSLVAYARNASPTEAVPVEPDHGWQFQSEVRQKLGTADVSASYSTIRKGTVTEFGFSGLGVQAPVSTTLKKRDEVGVSLDVPLESLGLDDTVVAGKAHWRDSAVLDPLTGKYRRASGEVPSDVQLRLEHKIPGQKLRFGLTGDLSGGQTSYQTQEISQTEASRKLGAFLAIQPGASYEVNLDVDGLIGTPSTVNQLYEGSRTDPQIPRVQNVPGPGPTVKLSLKHDF